MPGRACAAAQADPRMLSSPMWPYLISHDAVRINICIFGQAVIIVPSGLITRLI